ncbi:hypothetical protein T01_4967 [Trichinella spiralis]|uniref:Uncharacterized protein n=1 Tax=Trichinella spiralis TaxID=6334 RepID=A0A0V1BCX9_TRISP|nr:hypothetical protein T01_4967 [Trichinella spiralis]
MNSGALVRLINVASTGLGKALKAHCSAMNCTLNVLSVLWDIYLIALQSSCSLNAGFCCALALRGALYRIAPLRGPLYSLHVLINEAWLRYR